MKVTEWRRKQCVDREDGDGKDLGEQIGSCPTSARHTGGSRQSRFEEGLRSFSSGLGVSCGLCAYMQSAKAGMRGKAANIETEKTVHVGESRRLKECT